MRGGGGVTADDRLDVTEAAHVLRRTASMMRPYRRLVITALVFVALATATTVLGPIVVRYAIDEGIQTEDRGALVAAVIAYAVLMVITYFAGRQQQLFVNRAGEAFLRALRVRLFAHIQRQSLAFFDRIKAGVLVSRMTADIESMSELVQWGAQQFATATLVLSFSTIVLFTMSWQLGLVVVAVTPIIAIASRRFQRDSNVAYLDVRDRIGQNLSAIQEGLSGVRVIQAAAREPEQRRRFKTINRELYGSHMHTVKVTSWFFGLVEFCGVLATALALWAGAWLVDRGSVSVGTVVAVILLVAAVVEPVNVLSQLYNSLQSSTASLRKMYDILDTVPDVDERPGAVDLPRRGDLVVDSITFAYPGTTRPALHDVSVTVADGERLALVGATGAGKSSLAKLMARLYDPDAGSVSLAGIDLRDATLRSLREQIVVIPQEGFLFDGTIADNLRVAAPDATDAELDRALVAIGVAARFAELPDGLQTEVRERGSRLSAGERQLVALARAALVDPAVLVLDEATSNLDPGTEAEVEAALDLLMRGRTTIVVAHRLSTVQRADRIIVTDAGRIVEVGSHAELVTLPGGRYAKLAEAWLHSNPAA